MVYCVDLNGLLQKCRERDPTLTIKYKQKKLEQVGREETKKAKKR